MKTAYIISYDLNAPGQDYENIEKAITSYSEWIRIGGSVYVVVANATATEVRDRIKSQMDSNDQLFVGAVKAPVAWDGYEEKASDWLLNILRRYS